MKHSDCSEGDVDETDTNQTAVEGLNLFCQVLGDSDAAPFPVEVDGGITVGKLKDIIKEKAQISVAAPYLKLFKWNQPEHIKKIDLDSTDELNPLEVLKNFFSGDDSPKGNFIHIIVQVPKLGK